MTRRKPKRPLPREKRHVQLPYWLLDSDAFRELPGNCLKLLCRLATRHNGSNNGFLSMSTREAAKEMGCSHNHAAKCFRVLEDLGFIRVTQKGAFSWKKRHATTWRLTWLDCGDEPATKEFMRSDRGRRTLINGRLVDPNQKKSTVSHGATDSTTA